MATTQSEETNIMPICNQVFKPVNIFVFFSAFGNSYIERCVWGYLSPSSYMGLLRQYLAESIGIDYEKSAGIDIDELFSIFVQQCIQLGNEKSISNVIFKNIEEIGIIQGRGGILWEIDEDATNSYFKYEKNSGYVDKLCTCMNYDDLEVFRVTIGEILSMEERLARENKKESSRFTNRPLKRAAKYN